jgi:hypothetical protein
VAYTHALSRSSCPRRPRCSAPACYLCVALCRAQNSIWVHFLPVSRVSIDGSHHMVTHTHASKQKSSPSRRSPRTPPPRASASRPQSEHAMRVLLRACDYDCNPYDAADAISTRGRGCTRSGPGANCAACVCQSTMAARAPRTPAVRARGWWTCSTGARASFHAFFGGPNAWQCTLAIRFVVRTRNDLPSVR